MEQGYNELKQLVKQNLMKFFALILLFLLSYRFYNGTVVIWGCRIKALHGLKVDNNMYDDPHQSLVCNLHNRILLFYTPLMLVSCTQHYLKTYFACQSTLNGCWVGCNHVVLCCVIFKCSNFFSCMNKSVHGLGRLFQETLNDFWFSKKKWGRVLNGVLQFNDKRKKITTTLHALTRATDW